MSKLENLSKILLSFLTAKVFRRPSIYWKLDMSFSFTRTGIRCLVPVPRRLTTWLLPFEPFQLTLWLGISGCLFLEFFGLVLSRKMGKEEIQEHSWKSSLEFGYISTLKLFISQGTNFFIKSTSVRIVLFSCYMIDIIITSVYSGGLSSILTIPAFEEPADTVERLVKQNLEWGGTSIDWILIINNTMDGPLLRVKELFKVFNINELRTKILTERIGVVAEKLQWGHVALYTFIDQEMADRMKLMTEDLYGEHIVAFMPRPWALLEKFNDLILLVESSGISKYWEWKVIADNLDEKLQRQIEASTFTNFADSGPVELGIENFAGIIVIWFGGIILSNLVFLIEILYYRKFNF